VSLNQLPQPSLGPWQLTSAMVSRLGLVQGGIVLYFPTWAALSKASGSLVCNIVQTGCMEYSETDSINIAEMVGPGADWSLVDTHGTFTVDARNQWRTPEGDVIYVQSSGLANLTSSTLLSKMLFETGSEQYWWLNNIFFVAQGSLNGSTINFNLWEVCFARHYHGSTLLKTGRLNRN
jgi:hypothetical protein